MNKVLDTTDTPFGKAVMALNFRRNGWARLKAPHRDVRVTRCYRIAPCCACPMGAAGAGGGMLYARNIG
jgi:hypothetical protein